MPSPIAHAAMGWLLHRHLGRDLPAPNLPIPAAGLCLTIGLSLLPDLDFIPGLLFGAPAIWHNQGAHSLLAAALVACLLAPCLRWWLGGPILRWIGLVFACYLLHVLMDSGSVGRGVRLLWPFSLERLAPPIPLFAGVRWNEGLASPKHFWTLANELSFVLFLWASSHGLERWLRGQPKGGAGTAANNSG